MRFVLTMLMMLAATLAAPMTVYADDRLITPHPDIAPIDVVRIQLNALQNNDDPEIDFGIKQTWAFAHPDNRAVTGPFDRFAEMIKNPAYQPLINHKRHTVTEQNRSTKWIQFKVLMEDGDGQVLGFAWVVKKAKTEACQECWMTTGVSAPVRAGQGS